LRLCARQSIYPGTFHNGCLTANPFILVKSFLAQRRKDEKFFRIKKSPFIWQNGISVIAISLSSSSNSKSKISPSSAVHILRIFISAFSFSSALFFHAFSFSSELSTFSPTKLRHPSPVMNPHETARVMANRLRATIHAERVWLFGSQARGNAGPDSDVDLLAVVPGSSLSRYQRAVAARRELASFNIPMDIVVLTHEEWEKQLKAPCSLASTVTREGIAI